jgi:hypothetical protein
MYERKILCNKNFKIVAENTWRILYYVRFECVSQGRRIVGASVSDPDPCNLIRIHMLWTIPDLVPDPFF